MRTRYRFAVGYLAITGFFLSFQDNLVQGQELIPTPDGVPCIDGIPVYPAPLTVTNPVEAPHIVEGQQPAIDVTKRIMTLEEWERLVGSEPPKDAPPKVATSESAQSETTSSLTEQEAKKQSAIDEKKAVEAAVPPAPPAPDDVALSTKESPAACDGRCQLVPGNPLWTSFMDLVRQAATQEARAQLTEERLRASEREHEKHMQHVQAELREVQERMQRLEREKQELSEQVRKLEAARKEPTKEAPPKKDPPKKEPPKKDSHKKDPPKKKD